MVGNVVGELTIVAELIVDVVGELAIVAGLGRGLDIVVVAGLQIVDIVVVVGLQVIVVGLQVIVVAPPRAAVAEY